MSFSPGPDGGPVRAAVSEPAVPAGEVRLPEAAGGVRHVQGRLLASLHCLQEGQRRGEELYT